MRLLITGGAGFIGSHLVRHMLRAGHSVLNVDKLTYAGNLDSLAEVVDHPNYQFAQIDICDGTILQAAFADFQPHAVMHLAAESHVDRSIEAPAVFLQTNVLGTFVLLQESRRFYESLSGEKRDNFRFLNCSTDEVFGSLELGDRAFAEATRYDPHSPYSASKAAADHFVRAWHSTYGLPVIVTHSSNNYGPNQYPEKLIPVVITKALHGDPIPVYGSGEQIRDWIHVEDHCQAMERVLNFGRIGETYNIGANCELRNLDLVRMICRILDEIEPQGDGFSYVERIVNVADRPGHDFRYALDVSKTKRELNWEPQKDFAIGLKETVAAYCHALRRDRRLTLK